MKAKGFCSQSHARKEPLLHSPADEVLCNLDIWPLQLVLYIYYNNMLIAYSTLLKLSHSLPEVLNAELPFMLFQQQQQNAASTYSKATHGT